MTHEQAIEKKKELDDLEKDYNLRLKILYKAKED